MNEWKLSSKASPDELKEARIQSHWASQLVGAAGASILPEREDYTHTSLTRPPGQPILVGEPLDDNKRRVGLSVARLQLVVLDENLDETQNFSLAGKTLDEGRRWLGERLGTEIKLVGYELPSHPVGEGGTFALEHPLAFEALSQGFVNASSVLDAEAPDTVRCWPHHFDIAYLLTLGGKKSIGVGWTAGDDSYDEPYWYVTPWPYPKYMGRPSLARGHWHDEGFVAAILTASEMSASVDAASERQEVEAFLSQAMAGARSLLRLETTPNE